VALCGPGRGAEVEVRVEVLDPTAAAADQMVVLVGARVVEGGAFDDGGAADDAEVLEEVEGRVDGRKRNVGKLWRDGGEHLLSGHVAVEPAQSPVDDEPLRRHAVAAPAERRGQLPVDSLLFG
jgi:hypothetical protein